MRRKTYERINSHFTHTALTCGFRWTFVGKFGYNAITTYHT